MRNEDEFRNLVVGRSTDGYLVRLGEVAQVQLAAENQRGGSATELGPALLMPVTPTSPSRAGSSPVIAASNAKCPPAE